MFTHSYGEITYHKLPYNIHVPSSAEIYEHVAKSWQGLLLLIKDEISE